MAGVDTEKRQALALALLFGARSRLIAFLLQTMAHRAPPLIQHASRGSMPAPALFTGPFPGPIGLFRTSVVIGAVSVTAKLFAAGGLRLSPWIEHKACTPGKTMAKMRKRFATPF
jgi:hypothetical protein